MRGRIASVDPYFCGVAGNRLLVLALKRRKDAVLVTGGAGYIGSVITDQLIADGHAVVVYDNLSKGHADAVAREATFVEADLRPTIRCARRWSSTGSTR